MKKLLLPILFMLHSLAASAACIIENTGFSLTDITVRYRCALESEFPTSGLNLGDTAIAADTGRLAYATSATTWGLSYATVSSVADDQVLVGTGAGTAAYTAIENCNDTTGKLDWTGTAFACVTVKAGSVCQYRTY